MKISSINPQYLDNIVNTIGKKRSLLILLLLGESKKLRYKQLATKLGKISPSTLSLLLKQLTKQGLIENKSLAKYCHELQNIV